MDLSYYQYMHKLKKISTYVHKRQTCLQSIWFWHPSIHCWWNERGITGSDKDRKKVNRQAATEYTLPAVK